MTEQLEKTPPTTFFSLSNHLKFYPGHILLLEYNKLDIIAAYYITDQMDKYINEKMIKQQFIFFLAVFGVAVKYCKIESVGLFVCGKMIGKLKILN